ncbi:ZIP family metal transporter [bacterium]|nr:ZIP family metal transporter [bacterium]
MTLTLIAIGAFVATFLGGFLALRIQDKLHLVLGFSAGAVIGVAFFDLLPEAINLSTSSGLHDASFATMLMAAGFVVYMILDRFALSHHSDDHCENEQHLGPQATRGYLGAGSLSVHSFLDGLGVGLAFQVSPTVGLIVALAVLAHDFSDGINTVSLIVKNGGSRASALRWLAIDAVAPVLGIVVSSFFSLSEATLGLALSVFCGFFLYIGASELLPESHHNHPTVWTTVATVLGVVVLWGAVSLAGL